MPHLLPPGAHCQQQRLLQPKHLHRVLPQGTPEQEGENTLCSLRISSSSPPHQLDPAARSWHAVSTSCTPSPSTTGGPAATRHVVRQLLPFLQQARLPRLLLKGRAQTPARARAPGCLPGLRGAHALAHGAGGAMGARPAGVGQRGGRASGRLRVGTRPARRAGRRQCGFGGVPPPARVSGVTACAPATSPLYAAGAALHGTHPPPPSLPHACRAGLTASGRRRACHGRAP